MRTWGSYAGIHGSYIINKACEGYHVTRAREIVRRIRVYVAKLGRAKLDSRHGIERRHAKSILVVFRVTFCEYRRNTEFSLREYWICIETCSMCFVIFLSYSFAAHHCIDDIILKKITIAIATSRHDSIFYLRRRSLRNYIDFASSEYFVDVFQ